MAKNKGGSSKTFSSVIAFLLGFLFAIIVEVAAICGFGYYAYTTPIENLFSLFKIQNADAEGKQYVNTEEASTIKELVSVLSTKVSEIGAQSIDDFETLFPALSTALKTVYSTLNQYADLDEEEFESTQFMNIVTYLQEVALNIRPSKLLTAMGNTSVTGDDANVIVKALLVGAEASYVTIGETNYPVFCDTYTYSPEVDAYYRTSPVDGTDVYPFGDDTSYLYASDTDNEDSQSQYNLYYIPCIVNASDSTISPATVAEGFTGFKYSDDDKDWVRTEKNDKNEDVNINIFEENENLVYVAVKRGEDGTFTLDTDALSTNPTSCVYPTDYGENFIKLTGTYFKTNDGTEVQVFPVTLNSLMGSTYAPLYYVSIVDAIKSDSGENKVVNEMFSGNNLGELLDGKIDFDEKIQNMTLSTVVESIKPNGTMMSIVYNVKSVTSETTTTTNEDGSTTETTVWTGTYKYTENGVDKTKPVTIILDEEGYVEKVVDENGDEVEGNKVSEIASTADSLEITDTMKFKPTDAIMTYIGYGITKVRAQSGTTADGSEYAFTGKADITIENDDDTTNTATVDCYMAVDGEGYLTEAWYMTADDGNYTVRNNLSGATTSEITDRVNKINEKLTLPDIITVKADENIMLYVSYGITGVTAVEGKEYQYTGVYSVTETGDDETTTTTTTYPCYIYTKQDDSGAYTTEIDYITYDNNGTTDYVYGTIINDISARVKNLTSDMTIGEVMTTEGSSILTALKDTKINKIGEEIPNLKISEVLSEEDISKSSILSQLKDSTINSLSTDINSMSVQAIYAADIYGYKQATSYDEHITYYSYDTENGKYTEVEAGTVTSENYSSYYVLMQAATSYEAGYIYYQYDPVNDKFVLAGTSGKLTSTEFASGYDYYQEATTYVSGTTYYTYDETSGYVEATGITEFAEGTAYYTKVTSTTYYTYGSPTGMWKLLLCDTKYQTVTGDYDSKTTYYTYDDSTSDDSTSKYTKVSISEFASGTTYYTAYKDETVYYIENMNVMITNCTSSIYNSTLSELRDAGIITNVTDDELAKSFGGSVLGTMTFSELITAVIKASS